MTCRIRSVIAAAAAALAVAPTAALAAPTLISTRPSPDGEGGELAFFVGGFDDAGRSLKPSSVEVVADGERLGPPVATQALSDWAQVSAEASATWRPPLAVGLCYLWVEGIPSGVLDGIHAFFQRIPSRTTVYPTVYGRMRQGRARLAAADISRLDEVPYLEGYRPNAIEAIRLDLADLAADPAPLKVLLIVTDGRDFADPKGDAPGDFARLGGEIRKAGVTPLVIGFPPPDADAAQAAANLRDLHEAAGGFLRALDQADDLENTLESLGQGVADLLRVRVAPPWSWRTTGGTHRLSVRLTVRGGQRLSAEVGAVSVPGGSGLWIAIAALAAMVVIGAAVVVARRRGSASARDGGDDRDVVLAAAHDLIRRGASPARAVEELTRAYPEAVASLVDLDPEALDDPQYPYFRTRPGRLRMQEIRDILAKKSGDRAALSDELAGVLAAAVQNRTPPDEAAGTLAARASAEECTEFAGLGLDQLAQALRAAASAHPVLGTPRARGAAVAIQDALRARGSTLGGMLVGWLVRAAGPGRRGETLRLADGRTLLGSGPGCQVPVAGDPSVAAEHAEIVLAGGEFEITPVGGAVRVEGKAVERRQPLGDGDTIQIGAAMFVFKSATAGSMVSAGARR